MSTERIDIYGGKATIKQNKFGVWQFRMWVSNEKRYYEKSLRTKRRAEPIDAYNLSAVTEESFTLITKALWDKNTNLKFFEPINPNHVSHSIVNFQNNYSENTKSIEVEAVTLDSLLSDLNINKSVVSLMKFDIEGAEIEVLKRCIDVGIMPRQILVEFDELNVPSSKGFARVTEVDDLLRSNGYKLLKTDGQADFLYLK